MSEINNGIVPRLEAEIKRLEFQLQVKDAHIESLIETMRVVLVVLDNSDAVSLLEKTVIRHELSVNNPAPATPVTPVADAEQKPRFKVGDRFKFKLDGEIIVLDKFSTTGKMKFREFRGLVYASPHNRHWWSESEANDWLIPYSESASDDTA